MMMNKEKELVVEEIEFDVEKVKELENVEEIITPGAGTVFCCTN